MLTTDQINEETNKFTVPKLGAKTPHSINSRQIFVTEVDRFERKCFSPENGLEEQKSFSDVSMNFLLDRSLRNSVDHTHK